MSFSKFPGFQSFSLKDKEDYLKYYLHLKDPYCDFSLDDLWIWANYNHDLEVCELNGNLVLRFSNIIDKNTQYYTFIGASHLQATIDTLMNYLVSNSLEPKLSYIPEETAILINQLNNPRLKADEDVNNRDYVYSVEDLLGLEGKPYENLRRRINHFKRDNHNIHIREFDLQSKDERDLIKATITKWSHRTSSLRNDPEGWELSVIKTHLNFAEELPVYAYGLYADDNLVNINMFNLPPHKEWLIFNHIKCDYTHRDIYGYAFYALCQVAESKDIKWINFEQDLGIEGLRQIKNFFRPAKFLKRYNVSLSRN